MEKFAFLTVVQLSLTFVGPAHTPRAYAAADDEPSTTRVWHDVTGKFQVRAEFLDAEFSSAARDTLVTLKTDDGRVITVPSRKLSPADRTILGQLVAAQQRRAKEAAEQERLEREKELAVKRASVGWFRPPSKEGLPKNGLTPIPAGSRPGMSPSFEDPKREIYALTFTRDGRYVVSGVAPGKIVIWQTATARRILQLKVDTASQNTHPWVELAANDQRLFVGTKEEINCWDFKSGTHLGGLGSGLNNIGLAGVRSDGRRVAIMCHRTPYRWDIPEGMVREFQDAPSGNPSGVLKYSPDGTRICYEDNCCVLADADTGESVDELDTKSRSANSIVFSPKGDRIAAGLSIGIFLWTADGEPIHQFEHLHRNSVPGLAISPDGRLLATASYDGRAILIDLDKNAVLHEFKWTSSQSPTAVAFHPDGKRLFIGRRTGAIESWDVVSREMIRTFCRGEKPLIRARVRTSG
jgi:WD40 repeat protein